MHISPPLSEAQLLSRAHSLAGMTLKALAQQCALPVPSSLLYSKGWIGQLLEKALGASAAHLDQPDFMHLGIELKTLPITTNGTPCGSTFICTVQHPKEAPCWELSRVWRKISKILWVPIETHPLQPIADRRIGTPMLWIPSNRIVTQLKQDWEELTELMALGDFEKLNAQKGTFLQIRPKAPNSKTFIQTIDQHGEIISTVPKGFYVRRLLTQQIIREHFIF